MTSTDRHNAHGRDEQDSSGLPLALIIHEGGDEDTFIACPTISGDTLILELDDGRVIEIDRRELMDRAA